MSIQHAIWLIDKQPKALKNAILESENLLEEMIVAEPKILNDDWMLIGRQIDTGFSGRLDLLAIAPDGGLILIELKRDRTPRDVIAQAIDYATFVEQLNSEVIYEIYKKFSGGKDLNESFKSRFGQQLDDETLNQNHQIVVVASSIDSSTERIVKYLSDRNISINILCFQVFEHGDNKILSRVWLIDPVETQTAATPKKDNDREPWNGEIYVSFGQDNTRSWNEAVKYGFISAGGGQWYSNTLKLLNVGDRIWVKAPSYGFVGVGIVTGAPTQLIDYKIPTDQGEKDALDVLNEGHYLREYANDKNKCEYFVSVEWKSTVKIDNGLKGVGLFGNQNTVCKPTTPKWRMTVERLKEFFNER